MEYLGTPIDYTDRDLDIAARTMLGEARGQGIAGLAAVGNVLANRAYDPVFAGQYGRSVAQQALAPNQFSAWNYDDPNRQYMVGIPTTSPQYQQALDIARSIFEGRTPDNTRGALNYRNADVAPGSLYHGRSERSSYYDIGDHRFSRFDASARAPSYAPSMSMADRFGMAEYGLGDPYNAGAFAGVPTDYGNYAFSPEVYAQSYFDHEPPGSMFGFEGIDPNWGGIPQADLPGSLYGLAPDNLGVPMAAEPGSLYGLEGPQPTYGMPTDWGVGMNFGSPTFDMSYTPQQSPQMNIGVPDVPAPLNVGDFGGSNIDWGGLLQGATLDGWNPDFSTYAEDLGIGDIEAPGALVSVLDGHPLAGEHPLAHLALSHAEERAGPLAHPHQRFEFGRQADPFASLGVEIVEGHPCRGLLLLALRCLVDAHPHMVRHRRRPPVFALAGPEHFRGPDGHVPAETGASGHACLS